VAADFTYRLRTPHRAGQLALVASAIAEHEGLIGDIDTLNLGREASIREITVEVRDEEHAERVAATLGELDGVEVLWFGDRALLHHEGGKLTIEPARPVRSLQDMRDIYTPGVARACRAIEQDPGAAGRYTMIGRTVAICTNGTRVLGLGDIGPVAAMPVMEGKAVFYRQFAGISAMPILIDSRDPGEFVEAVMRIAPTFGGIHLEDIEAPACFEIENVLRERLDKPVMHDDVHGTAVVSLAAVIVGCRHAGLMLKDATVGQLGLGAAGFGIAQLMVEGGVSRVLGFDPNEDSHARARGAGIEVVEQDELMREADVVVATTGRAGLIDPAQIRKGQVILALTNPDPEIRPEQALEAGAAFAGDGSMINNVLGYPGIFKGALQAGAEEINVDMKLAAAWAIAGLAVEAELVPDVLDPEVHDKVAEAVREAAKASGAARPKRAAEL
jgi:malate dehydrogenase (oxaloacetate-decarboxylating)